MSLIFIHCLKSLFIKQLTNLFGIFENAGGEQLLLFALALIMQHSTIGEALLSGAGVFLHQTI